MGRTAYLETRLGIYNCGSPFRDFILRVTRWFDNCKEAEARLLKSLRGNGKYEWINMPTDDVVALVNGLPATPS